MRLFIILFIAAACPVIFAQNSTMPTTAPSTPPFCSLSPAQLAAQRKELIPGLFKRAQKVTDIPNGLRFDFDDKPGLIADLSRAIEQEQDCCSFLQFQLTVEPHAGPIHFEVTGPKGTAQMLRNL